MTGFPSVNSFYFNIAYNVFSGGDETRLWVRQLFTVSIDKVEDEFVTTWLKGSPDPPLPSGYDFGGDFPEYLIEGGTFDESTRTFTRDVGVFQSGSAISGTVGVPLTISFRTSAADGKVSQGTYGPDAVTGVTWRFVILGDGEYVQLAPPIPVPVSADLQGNPLPLVVNSAALTSVSIGTKVVIDGGGP